MRFATFISLFTSLFLFADMLTAQNTDDPRFYHLLIGTYTSGTSEGIYVYRFDSKTGEITHEYTATGVENPSFLTVSADGKYVYAVNEVSGEKPGAVSAFHFDQTTGALEFINQQPSGGGDPCYLTLDENQKHLFVGNYTGGNLSALPILTTGALATANQTIQHEGMSINTNRQEKPHVHSTVLTPDEKYLFVGDLGTDQVNSYAYNPNDTITPLNAANPASIKVTPGGGPRHIIFDKSGEYAYVILELTAEINVYKHDNGKLEHLQTVSMTAKDFEGEVGAAELKISPDGKFLYATNRGDANEIVAYKIDPSNGNLNLIERKSTLGEAPRNFMIDPTGKFILVAHQNSNNIVLFERDMNTGKLSAGKTLLEIGNPVYLKMIEVKEVD